MKHADEILSTVDAQAVRDPSRATLLILSPEGTRQLPVPEQGRLTVGRHPDSDICLEDPLVSRRHAVLCFEGMRTVAEDLGGANGTEVGGTRLEAHAPQVVGLGVPVQIGGTVLWVRHAAPSPAVDEDLVHSPRMRAVYEEATQIARGRLSVLVLGDTGVGKEVVARALHARSPRHAQPLVTLNCGALAESLLESELFGYEKGAFTGADRPKPGLLEAADQGTMFLDEVGELPLSVQVKLLRVIENQEVMRLGALQSRRIDVRFVAATNRDLQADAENKRFRQDLYFRLAGTTLVVPPLRDRPEEIMPFARYFAAQAAKDAGLPTPDFTDMAETRLHQLPWPGNLRELKNAVTRAVLLCRDGRVDEALLPALSTQAAVPAPPAGPGHWYQAAAPTQGLTEVQLQERARVVTALQETGGNQTRAARRLGVSRQTLVKKLDRYGLPRPRK